MVIPASVTTAAPAGARTHLFSYDGTGNTPDRAGTAARLGPDGKLAKVTEGDKHRFVYGADGDRLMREDPTSITLYLDGQELKLNKARREDRHPVLPPRRQNGRDA